MVYVKNAEINKKIYTSIDNESHYHQIIHGGWMQHLTHLQSIFLCLVIVPLHLLAQDELDDFFEPKTSIGGYGELHYNFNKVGNNAPTKTLDFHRFVLYVGHAWTEKWSFRSEIELEHNLVKDGQGILQLEQAFLNYQQADYLSFQAGVLLVASSFINEYHEPVFFPSVERPEYTKFIIPTTWFGNGIGVYGFYSGFDYRLVIIEGLAILDNVYGKSQPITFLVILSADGTIKKTAIIRYREPYGGAVASQRWLNQFTGLSSSDKFSVNQEIDAISGATISVGSVTVGIYKLTLLWEYYLKNIQTGCTSSETLVEMEN
ncbi:hypothetical protein ES705_36841 [subsurface metagenome]